MVASSLELDCRVEEYATRDEWLAARRSLIGASDTAGILNAGYADQTPATVWESKVSEPPEVSAAKLKRFNVAKRLEPAMRGIFEDETGLPCWSLGDYTICRHSDIDWLGASLDGLTEHPEFGLCVVELKDVGAHNRKEWEADEPPLKFTIQVNHQMLVTGRKHGFLMGLIGREPVIKHVPRNEKFVAAMMGHLEAFWACVQGRETPPIDSSLAAAQVLSRLWPEDSGMTVVLPNDAIEWAAEKQFAETVIKQMKAVETAAENKIKAAIKDATFGDLPSCPEADAIQTRTFARLLGSVQELKPGHLPSGYSWKTQSRAEYVCKATSFRVLRRHK